AQDEPGGQHAEKQRSQQNADERSAEYRAHLGGRKTPILNNRGSKIAESLNIESVHDQAKGTQNKDAGLKCSDLALVDGFGDVDRAFHYGFREYITINDLPFRRQSVRATVRFPLHQRRDRAQISDTILISAWAGRVPSNCVCSPQRTQSPRHE